MTPVRTDITSFLACEIFTLTLNRRDNSRYDSVDDKLETVQVSLFTHRR